MKRRDFLRRLGIIGAATVVAKEAVGKIIETTDEPFSGGEGNSPFDLKKIEQQINRIKQGKMHEFEMTAVHEPNYWPVKIHLPAPPLFGDIAIDLHGNRYVYDLQFWQCQNDPQNIFDLHFEIGDKGSAEIHMIGQSFSESNWLTETRTQHKITGREMTQEEIYGKKL